MAKMTEEQQEHQLRVHAPIIKWNEAAKELRSMGCNSAAIILQRKQNFYENGVIFCIFILQETKAAPFLFVYKSATWSECPHQKHNTWEMRGQLFGMYQKLYILPHSSLERCSAPKHITAAYTAPFYSHWWTQWGQTPPRDFPHPAELSFCPAVLPRAWYCKLQPRVSTGGHYSRDNQHLSRAESRVKTQERSSRYPPGCRLLQQHSTLTQVFHLRDTEL